MTLEKNVHVRIAEKFKEKTGIDLFQMRLDEAMILLEPYIMKGLEIDKTSDI